jgi:hypothetical protein
MAKEEDKILNKFFKINKEVVLVDEELDYLDSLKEEIRNIIEEEGEVGDVKIKEIVLDELLKLDFNNVIKYLGLDIDQSIKDNINNKLNDTSFLKVENVESDLDFFSNYLKDEIVNDLILSLKGYERKAEGTKEIFMKKRTSLIPTSRIDSINRILVSKFNKTEFLSNKSDDEQALIIMFILEQIFEQLLEIPYDLCDTQKTMEILTMVSVKLTNSIGISKDFRKELMDTLKESMQTKRNQNSGGGASAVME